MGLEELASILSHSYNLTHRINHSPVISSLLVVIINLIYSSVHIIAKIPYIVLQVDVSSIVDAPI